MRPSGAPDAGEVCAVDVAALVAAHARRGASARNVAPTLAALGATARPAPEVAVAVHAAPAEDGERVCRVCLAGDDDGDEAADQTGPLVELRCACRGGMRLAHAPCAERWFLSKGSGMCEVCNQPAWDLSAEALCEAAAKRAEAAALAAAQLPSQEALRLAHARASWEYTQSARVRLLLIDTAILLGLAFSALSDAVLRGTRLTPHSSNVFISFVVSALAVAAARDMLAYKLRWFTTRLGLGVLTVVVSCSLLGYVYSSLWGGGFTLGMGSAGVKPASTTPSADLRSCSDPSAPCASGVEDSGRRRHA